MPISGGSSLTPAAIWAYWNPLKQMPPEVGHQDNPTVDAWYDAAILTKASLDYILFYHNWTEARQVDIRMTVDGEIMLETLFDATDHQVYYCTVADRTHLGVANLEIVAAKTPVNIDGPLKGQDVLIEHRAREALAPGFGIWTTAIYHRLE